jgi:superfamily I DNA/RNA helicase
MKERVGNLVTGKEGRGLTVSTFHNLGLALAFLLIWLDYANYTERLRKYLLVLIVQAPTDYRAALTSSVQLLYVRTKSVS